MSGSKHTRPHRAAFSDLYDEAHAAASKAFAPYSKFRVGAVLVTASGKRYMGVNVENAAFPSGSCAEQIALGAACAAEGPDLRLEAIGVAAIDPDGKPLVCSPCGACRQRIIQFGPATQVAYLDPHQRITSKSIDQLLPDYFVFER